MMANNLCLMCQKKKLRLNFSCDTDVVFWIDAFVRQNPQSLTFVETNPIFIQHKH